MLYLNSVHVFEHVAPGMRSALTVACGLALSLVAGWVGAQEQALETVVVSAIRAPQPVSRTLSDVSIIDRDTIERSSGRSVGDVLSGLPGVEIAKSGGIASTTSVFLRGSDKRHVLVLIDGVPFDSQASGGATWEVLPLQHIERIEVLKGPVSAAYGSDAMAGVVQIFTRKGEGPPRLDFGIGGGDLGMASADVALSGRRGAWDYLLSSAAERSRDFNSRTNTVPGRRAADRDGYANNSYHVKIGYQASDDHRLQGSVLHQHQNAQYDASASSTADDRALRDLHSVNLSWAAKWSKEWDSILTLGQTDDDYQIRPFPYDTLTRLNTASWTHHLNVGAHTFVVILERRETNLVNSSLVQTVTGRRGGRSTNALGIGHEGRFGAFMLASNVRKDWDTEYGSQLTGSMSAGYDLNAQWRLRGTAGTAFKTPTLYQQFSPYGNAALRPENGRNREIGLEYRHQSTHVGASLYDNLVKDFIEFSNPGVCPSTANCYRNVTSARMKGVELSGGVSVERFRLTGSIDLSAPKNLQTDRLLSRRARRHASLRVEAPFANDVIVGLQGTLHSGRIDYTGTTGAAKPLGGYALWTADATGRIHGSVRWLVRVDNLTNKVYQTANTYASAPRKLFVGLRWSYGL